MAIRTINYSVSSDGISPKTEQRAGLQSEHAVTQLVFTLDNTLYQALLDEKQDGDTLVYRFDCIDSTSGTVRTDTAELTDSVITFTVGENLTRNGGKARVYLVISRYNAEEETEIEMLSFPARLRFENVPASDNGNSRESLSTLAEAAKNAAKRSEQSAESAKQSAAAAAEAQNNAEAVLLAVEEKLDVIDQTYDPTSENAQSGKAVAEAIAPLSERVSNNDAELADIRVGADGTTYSSAGESVRGQISEIKEDLSDLYVEENSLNLLDISKVESGYFVDQTSGVYTAKASHSVIKNVAIDGDSITISTDLKAWNYAFRYALYSSDKTYISGELLNTAWSSKDNRYYITIDMVGAKYISISCVSESTLFLDNARLQIALGTVTDFYEYKLSKNLKVDTETNKTVKEEIIRLENTIVSSKTGKAVDISKSGSLSNGQFLIVDESTCLKEYTIVLNAKVTSFSKIVIGVCYDQETLLNRIEIDGTTVINKNFFKTVTSYNHNLAISNDIQVRIKVNYNLTADITIISNGNIFEQNISWVSTTTPIKAFVSSENTVLSECKLVEVADWNRKIIAFGDSYFNYATDRWAYYVDSYGYLNNMLINASPGIPTKYGTETLQTMIAHANSKYMLWCLGMNDGSDTDVNTPQILWKNGVDNFISVCRANRVEPILATIPTVPTINHEGKNKYVRESGCRYIDFAKAVGADSNGNWYDGMLEDNTARIHPTVQGARCLFMQALSDLPEIMVD